MKPHLESAGLLDYPAKYGEYNHNITTCKMLNKSDIGELQIQKTTQGFRNASVAESAQIF